MHAFARFTRRLAPVLAALCLTVPAQAAVYVCKVRQMIGNEWICTEQPDYCTFLFVVNEKDKTMTRKGPPMQPRIPVVVDKWSDEKIVAHEDRPRVDNRFIEQFWYKIVPSTGEFLLANEYMTNSGRYLTQADMDASDKKRFSYYRPRLFSETGKCRFKRQR